MGQGPVRARAGAGPLFSLLIRLVMSTISNQLTGFIFNGAALALASAPWKDKVRAIYGFTASGRGYQVFKPTNGYNSLTQLSQDGVYIVDAATPGFELPGAVLTAGPPATSLGPGPLSIGDCYTAAHYNPQLNETITAIHFDVRTTNYDSKAVLATVDDERGVRAYVGVANAGVDVNAMPFDEGTLTVGQPYTLTCTNRDGYRVSKQFTVAAPV